MSELCGMTTKIFDNDIVDMINPTPFASTGAHIHPHMLIPTHHLKIKYVNGEKQENIRVSNTTI